MRTRVPSVVASITVSNGWIAVVRGDLPLRPGSFRYADAFTDHFDQLSPLAT